MSNKPISQDSIDRHIKRLIDHGVKPRQAEERAKDVARKTDRVVKHKESK